MHMYTVTYIDHICSTLTTVINLKYNFEMKVNMFSSNTLYFFLEKNCHKSISYYTAQAKSVYTYVCGQQYCYHTTPSVLDKLPQELCTCSFQLHHQMTTSTHTHVSNPPLQVCVYKQCIAIIASSPAHS